MYTKILDFLNLKTQKERGEMLQQVCCAFDFPATYADDPNSYLDLAKHFQQGADDEETDPLDVWENQFMAILFAIAHHKMDVSSTNESVNLTHGNTEMHSEMLQLLALEWQTDIDNLLFHTLSKLQLEETAGTYRQRAEKYEKAANRSYEVCEVAAYKLMCALCTIAHYKMHGPE